MSQFPEPPDGWRDISEEQLRDNAFAVTPSRHKTTEVSLSALAVLTGAAVAAGAALKSFVACIMVNLHAESQGCGRLH